jgi:hypothetical protein
MDQSKWHREVNLGLVSCSPCHCPSFTELFVLQARERASHLSRSHPVKLIDLVSLRQDYQSLPVPALTPPPIASLPTELLILIATLLHGDDQYSFSRVCRLFDDIACPPFLASKGLVIPHDGVESCTTSVSDGAFAFLLHWRWSTTFRRASSLCCWFSDNTTECGLQMAQLRTFFLSLTSATPIRLIYLSLRAAEDHSMYFRLLESVRHTRCWTFSCFGPIIFPSSRRKQNYRLTPDSHPQLQTMDLHSPLFFQSAALDFTVGIISRSQIKELSLAHTKLTASQWKQFLPRLVIPTLQSLTIDGAVAMSALLSFLRRHSGIRSLYLYVGVKASRLHTTRATLRLPDLVRLSGPGSYIRSLLQSLALPPTLILLTISSDNWGGKRANFAKTVFNCLVRCKSIRSLSIELDPGVVRPHFFDPCGQSLPNVEKLSIRFLQGEYNTYTDFSNHQTLACLLSYLRVCLLTMLSGSFCYLDRFFPWPQGTEVADEGVSGPIRTLGDGTRVFSRFETGRNNISGWLANVACLEVVIRLLQISFFFLVSISTRWNLSFVE